MLSSVATTQYERLGSPGHERQTAYRALFKAHVDAKTLAEIRHATQKGWALGSDRFKNEIERLLQRRTRPLPRGGNHRSIALREDERLAFEKLQSSLTLLFSSGFQEKHLLPPAR